MALTNELTDDRIKHIIKMYLLDKQNIEVFAKELGKYLTLDVRMKWNIEGKDEEGVAESIDKIVEAYNRYRAAPYDWYEREETK
jgi:hypothetical protein